MNRRLAEPLLVRAYLRVKDFSFRSALFLVCFLCATCLTGPAATQVSVTENQPSAPSRDGQPFAQLMRLLSSIPNQWSSLGSPLIPSSGRAPAVIVKTASNEDLRKAFDLINGLAEATPAERSAKIRELTGPRLPNEIDLWVPASAAMETSKTGPERARVIAAWLQLSEAMARKDALLAAAGAGFELAIPGENLETLKDSVERWVLAAQSEPPSKGKALLERDYGEILFRIGSNAEGQDTFYEALKAYHSARAIFEQLHDQVGVGQTWIGEGDTLQALWRTEEALAAFDTAQQIFEIAHSDPGQGNAWKAKAEVFANLGEEEQALDAYLRARNCYQNAGSDSGEGYTWVGEAGIFLRSGRYEDARVKYEKAESLFKRGPANGEASAIKGEADVLLLTQRQDKALEAYRKARKLYGISHSKHGEGSTFLGEGRILLAYGNWHDAAKAADDAATRFATRERVRDQIQALLLKALAEQHFASPETAAASVEQAIILHSNRRSMASTDAHRTALDLPISAAYDILVPLRANSGKIEAALERAEESRARVLLDLLAAGHPSSDQKHYPPAQKIQGDLARLDDKFRSASMGERRILAAERARIDKTLSGIASDRLLAEKTSLPSVSPLRVAEIRKLADEAGCPILLFYVAPQETWGFLVSPGGSDVFARKIVVTRDQLSIQVHALARNLANSLYEPRATATTRQLWDLLIAPFAERLPAGGPLILVPHGPLHELPFEALQDSSKKFLFERWHVSVTPSVSALAFARQRHHDPAGDSFLSFSSTQGLDLPSEDISEITKYFAGGKSPLSSAEASFPDYNRLATQAQFLLIATRGIHVQGSRSQTYLEIQPTPDAHDSRLSAAEIATIPLRTELVALAACDTSHGAALLSDERLDLTRAFLIAGTASVLASRWKVPEDGTTSRFLADFFQAYRKGGPEKRGMRKDEALSKARTLSRLRHDPAQVWAAWVLVGDPR
ncbi:MAG TPA: CHAT domain-containing tetratricopeptide repeat protein [Thermoanaerobaculia bacterium]